MTNKTTEYLLLALEAAKEEYTYYKLTSDAAYGEYKIAVEAADITYDEEHEVLGEIYTTEELFDEGEQILLEREEAEKNGEKRQSVLGAIKSALKYTK